MGKIISYAFKCWITSAIIGVLGVLLYTILNQNQAQITGAIVGSVAFSVSMLIVIFLCSVIGYFRFRTPNHFRIFVSVICLLIWLSFSNIIFGIQFFNFMRTESLIAISQLIGLLFGIWYYEFELKKSIEIDDADILDVDI